MGFRHLPWDGPQKFAALERWLHGDDPQLDSALPTRLIDISSFSNSENNSLRGKQRSLLEQCVIYCLKLPLER
jgi:hypothetical protein